MNPKKSKPNYFKYFYLATMVFSLGFWLFMPRVIIAEEMSLTQSSVNILLDRAKQAYFSGNYQEAISIWLRIVARSQLESLQLASVYENIASVYWHQGNPGEAIKYWQKAIAIYREDESPASLAATLTDTARAYNDLGQPRSAVPLLNEALAISDRLSMARSDRNRPNKVKEMAYLTLGNARTIQGNYSLAIAAYQNSLTNLDSSSKELPIVLWQNLSQAYQQQAVVTEEQAIAAELEGLSAAELWQKVESDRTMAIEAAHKAIEIGKNTQSLAQAEALIQVAQLARKYDFDAANSLQQAEAILYDLPDSSQKVYALIDLGQLNNNYTPKSVFLLNSALKSAKTINNPRVISFATGAMGKYYESQQQYEPALYWTRQAQLAAEQAQAPDSLYQWDWQAARIYQQTGKTKAAIGAYENAIASLQLIRSNLAQTQGNSLFNFQNDIEPVYRSLIQLLLSNNSSDANIQKALQTKDLLLLSELENFFQDDCLTLEADTEAEILAYLKESNAAIVNTIILENKTYLIWQLPNGKTKKYTVDISQTELNNLVTQWRFDLENKENDNYLELSQQLYQLLFTSEIKSEIENIQLKNLIFVNDGILRNVPMAALHDGQNFLIENYAVSNSLGLNMRLKQPFSVQKAIAFGLTIATENFPPLPYVKLEIAKLGELVAEKQFLNDRFSYQNFKQQIESSQSSLVHIATHGQFGGTTENTFLQAYQSQISLKQLEQVLSNHNNNFPDSPIQLLVLSACDTASSNPRATLGMSGVAVRAGVNNVLGSLWSINDKEIVSLIDGFYSYWIQNKLTRSEALRQAQLDLINNTNNHPSNWSSMILIQGS